jgi:polyisoprenyl-phosphate glycosyltransferase
MNTKKLSIVIPVYNEGESIRVNIGRVVRVLKTANIDFEIILIDDGSKDNSWDSINLAAAEMPNIKAIRLSRNFGKENALCAGLDQVSGDGCLCMDADMQHPPELIPSMYKLWVEQGYDVIEGVKNNRGKEKLSYKLSSRLFYRFLKTTSGIDLDNASDFRLLDKRALEAWKSMPEKQTFFRGMSSWIGFRRTQCEFTVAERDSGHSKWSVGALIRLAIRSVTSYTAAPLYASAVVGFILLLSFAFLLCQTLIMKFLGYAADGFTTVIALQLVIGGMLLMSVGVIGIYIEKIYEEVKSRPRYIVQDYIESQIKIDSAGE